MISHRKIACFKYSGLCLIVSGVIFSVVLALLFQFLFGGMINDMVNQAIVDSVIITEIGDDNDINYAQWVQTNFTNAPPYYSIAYFYNLTNIEQIQNDTSIEPVFEEVGPYYYQMNRTKFNVEFLDNGTQVKWNELRQFNFLPELSVGDETDIIVNLNPAYLGTLGSVGSVLGVRSSLSGPILGDIFGWLTTNFVGLTYSQQLPTILQGARKKLGGNGIDSDTFYSVWANSTSPNSSWIGMTISEGKPSGMSIQSAESLWNESIEFSLTNPDDISRDIWYNATYLLQDTSIKTIKDNFDLSDDQMESVISWLNLNSTSFRDEWAVPYFSKLYPKKEGFKQMEDLGYIQWLYGSVLDGKSVTQVYKSYYDWNNCHEYFLTKKLGRPLTVSLTRESFFGGNLPLSNYTNMAFFLQYLVRGKLKEIEQEWGWGPLQISSFGAYIMTNLSGFGPHTCTSIIYKQIQDNGGGLVAVRNVNEWLYNAIDPLLIYTQPNYPNCALLRNDTSIESSMQLWNYSLFETGKNNYSAVQDYIEYQGKTSFPGFYDFLLTPWGTNDWGQFVPFQNDTNLTLYSFSDSNWRTVPIIYNGTKSTIKGVEMHRFYMDNSIFDVDPLYYQSIPGFNNLTGPNQDCPIFGSNPHFNGVPDKYISNIKIVNFTRNETTDITYIDIEPNTGKVMNVWQAMQINLYLNQKWFIKPPIPWNRFYPVAWIAQASTLNDYAASQIKPIYLAQGIVNWGWLILVVIGLIQLLIGSIFIYLAVKYRKHNEKEEVDEDHEGLLFDQYIQ